MRFAKQKTLLASVMIGSLFRFIPEYRFSCGPYFIQPSHIRAHRAVMHGLWIFFCLFIYFPEHGDHFVQCLSAFRLCGFEHANMHGTSIASQTARIDNKLEASGIIQSYTIVTDEAQVGNDLTALMEISLEHPRYSDSFVEYIQSSPCIVSCYYLTGEFDYMLKICCHSSRQLGEIHRGIKQQDGVQLTKTHYVLRTEKNIYSSLPEYPSTEQ